MPEEPPKDPILELVQWIDKRQIEKEDSIFLSNDSLRGEMRRIIGAFLVLYFVVWLATYEYGVNLALKGQFSWNTTIVAMSALLAALAVLIAGATFVQPYLEKNEIEVRYKRATELHDFTDDEKPFLRALIEIGSKNRGFTLKQLYDLDKTKVVFTEEKLLERLCK